MPDRLRDLAAQVATYRGSPEHKLPGARNDASICPAHLREHHAQLTQWLRSAIASGHVGGILEGEFPRYVWYRDGENFFEARLTNQERGEYKGYPIRIEEAPSALATEV